ncbi:SCP-like extracellular [Scytonema sp. HK-05]|uniref:CAP domain-containing protein n=1 Tax=Scytonema sp. HK-05 TaxID=1137095 RepID=UPI0009F87FAE|nr:CAP domain-containing protein [Scytonema sp. HK-05]BAY44081.1 SCP-like extracellular [Scytonema sp. HK-05]
MESSNNTTFEQQVFELTNQERAKNGLSPLKANAELNFAADKYAEEMSERRVLSHTGPDGSKAWDRAEAVGYEARMMGENIAAGQRTPEQVVKGWMDSPGHRANILRSQYTDIGVGFYNNYWVQDFGSGDTNPISNIPGSTSNSEIVAQSAPAPESTSTLTTTLGNIFSSDSQPTPESGSDTKGSGSDIITKQPNDWLLNGGVDNNTLSTAPKGDTFIVGEGANADWIKNLQLSDDKGVIGRLDTIFETLSAPQTQISNQTLTEDRNRGTLFAQVQDVNANSLIPAGSIPFSYKG